MGEEVTIKDYVESKMVTSFKISGCPIKIYNEFKEFSIVEAGNNYSMAIKILLDKYRSNSVLEQTIDTLTNRITKLETKSMDEELKENKKDKELTGFFGDRPDENKDEV